MKDYLFLKQLHFIFFLVYVSPCNGQFETAAAKENANKPVISTQAPKAITRTIVQDKKGNYWLATWEGIIRYDGKHFTNMAVQEGLFPFHVFSILEDTGGNMWFGTINGGIYRYDGNSFTQFTTKDGLPSDVVTCMLEDPNGNIWFGTNKGASFYNGKTFTNYTTQDGLSSNSINTIARDKTGKIWFGTQYGGNGDVSFYDGKLFTLFKNEGGPPFLNVRSIISDKTGTIWFGGQNGLIRYDGTTLANVIPNFIATIYEDKSGNLWLSQTEPIGMALYKYDGKSALKIGTGSMIFGITEDHAGNIWFGTGDGISRYDGKSFSNFTE